jgi:hypothetical protein
VARLCRYAPYVGPVDTGVRVKLLGHAEVGCGELMAKLRDATGHQTSRTVSSSTWLARPWWTARSRSLSRERRSLLEWPVTACLRPCRQVAYFHEQIKGVDFVFVDHPSYPRPGGLYSDANGVYGDNQVRRGGPHAACNASV